MSFLCLDLEADEEIWTLQLLLLHAVYSATNCIRFSKAPVSLTCVEELLLQFLHQGASQSSCAQRVVHKYVTARLYQRARHT